MRSVERNGVRRTSMLFPLKKWITSSILVRVFNILVEPWKKANGFGGASFLK
jgi:hypothetical protein